MKTIWKFPLEVKDKQQVLMPRGAVILSAGIDNRGSICVWALVDPKRPLHVRPIRFVEQAIHLKTLTCIRL